MGFGRKKPAQPAQQIGPDGRPLVERWSAEHLTRLCADKPAFQVMTVDGLQWIDPFTKNLVSAAFDWQQAAVAWMQANKPWKKQAKPLSRDLLYQVRWAHYLHHHFDEVPNLRFILPNGLWLNPLNMEWVTVGRRTGGHLPKEARTIMAQAMAVAELSGAGCSLKDEYELKRVHDVALNKLHDTSRRQQSQSMSPVKPRSSEPSKSAGALSINSRRGDRMLSQRSGSIPSLELPPETANINGVPINRDRHFYVICYS